MATPVRSLLADATARLSAGGIDSPRVDAELLLAALLGAPRSRLAVLDAVPDSVARTFTEQVTRRVTREPLQHITGVAPFRHVELAVGPGVFVPRPETELLVDAVLPLLRDRAAPLVVDLCAGSGALAVAIADELPHAEVVAVERSAAAARWLLRNVAGGRVRVVVSDVRDPGLLRELHGRVDAVVTNPPYVPATVEVGPEVLADPAEAVFAGPDGLELIPAVLRRAAELLTDGGVLAVEHDESHEAEVPRLLAETDDRTGGWTAVTPRRDLTGRARFTVATRDRVGGSWRD